MNQDFRGTSRSGGDNNITSADLGSDMVTNIKQEHRLQTLLEGAFGSKNAERFAQPQDVPEHAAERLDMLRNEDIINLGKYYGDVQVVQGIITGIALSPDMMDTRRTALSTIAERNVNLSDLAIEVLLRDPDVTVRAEVLKHLSWENPLYAAYAAVRAIRTDPDQDLRVNALEILIDLDTIKAKEISGEIVGGSHRFEELRDFCRSTLERTDLADVKDSAGHSISAETEVRAALLSAALYENASDVSLKAAKQFLEKADEAEAITLGYALLNTPLRQFGYEIINSKSSELASLLPQTLTEQITKQ